MASEKPSKQDSGLNPFSQAPEVQETKQSTPPVAETVEEIKQAPVQTAAETDSIYGWKIEDMEFLDPGLTSAPKPPKFLADKFQQHDLVWRWLSYPALRALGKRGYTIYSPTVEEKEKINRGAGGGTVHVDANNYICWREDAILGVTPRRLYEHRRNEKMMRTMEQTKRSRSAIEPLKEAAGRLGAQVARYQVDEWRQEGED
jgi:hypothetical protein